jgi:hypothetical protein
MGSLLTVGGIEVADGRWLGSAQAINRKQRIKKGSCVRCIPLIIVQISLIFEIEPILLFSEKWFVI